MLLFQIWNYSSTEGLQKPLCTSIHPSLHSALQASCWTVRLKIKLAGKQDLGRQEEQGQIASSNNFFLITICFLQKQYHLRINFEDFSYFHQ